MASCGGIVIGPSGEVVRSFGMSPPPLPKGEIWRAMLAATCVAKPCVVARTAVLREVGPFDTTIPIGADQDMWIRLARAGEVEFVREHLTRIHDTAGSLTKVYRSRTHEFVLPMIRRHIETCRRDLSEDEIRRILAERFTSVGRTLYPGGARVRGLALIVRAMLLGGDITGNLRYLLAASPPADVARRLLRRAAWPGQAAAHDRAAGGG
jgi:hypothetical protein